MDVSKDDAGKKREEYGNQFSLSVSERNLQSETLMKYSTHTV